ncbi:14624_t:CDS:2 [Funneliformis caledonium]|uniref:14624_t:CDS:1 n=1 Tax=Funneliformis caledonium TaxID=1117310 RepID=A0A9N9B017_9GLOM|nr:14624_t:CDS:2 [Funneliformis caledonium]
MSYGNNTNKLNLIKRRRAKIAKSFSDGINFKVDVEIDAEVTYTLKSAKDEILIDDRSRRPVLFRFESPHFEPTDRIYYKVSSDLIEEPPVNWNWRVGDIDYLLEIEDLENEAREEKDLSQLED